MAGRQGKKNTDDYDYQQYSLLYVIQNLMECKARFQGFEIGSCITEYGAFDDIVLNLTLTDSKVARILMQVKNSKNMISKRYLCNDPKTYVAKYFNTFLDLLRRKENPIQLEQLDQLIIWTNMIFDTEVVDWFEKYVPTERDIFGDSTNLSYQRFRLKEGQYNNITFRFHPRMKLVYEIVDVLYKNQRWNLNSEAKSYFLQMRNQIIDENGVLKQAFIAEQNGLSEEGRQFQKCFKAVMKEKFPKKQIKAMYEKRLELKFDSNWKVYWKGWQNEENDLEEFCKRFVFYVNVPKVDELKACLMKFDEFKDSFTQVSELLNSCAHGRMINKKQVESLFLLIKLRKCKDREFGLYAKLQFNDPNDPLATKVKNFGTDENSGTCLHVQAVQDVYCTVSRLIPLVKNYLAPRIERYLVLTCANFYENWLNLQNILEVKPLVENGLQCIIIADVPSDQKIQKEKEEPSNKFMDIKTKLSRNGLQVILVGKSVFVDEETINFVDDFDISTLHQECKDKINNWKICLSENQEANAYAIFGDKLFQKENNRLALELFKSQNPIHLMVNKFQLDEHFRERKLMKEKESVLDFMRRDEHQQIVISDQAGMGKTTELTNIAVEMKKSHQDHLVVYLDCKTAVKHHDRKEDIADIVCQMTNITGETEKVVVQKIIELGKMILLVDGIDEVRDSCETNLKAFLRTISKANLFKLVIATRPHCIKLIEEILHPCIIGQLDHFSKSDQLEYLKSFWKVNELADENDRTRIEENAIQLIEQFRFVLKDESFIRIPLQTYMIAVIYKTTIISINLNQPGPEFGDIYGQFIEMKFEEFFARQFDRTIQSHEIIIPMLKRMFIQDHVILAHKKYANSPESEINDLGAELQPYGLVRLHPSVEFVHYTYYEYFISLYFLTYATNASQFDAFMLRHLCVRRESIVTKFIDFHIGKIDPSRKPETDNSITDCLPNDFEPPPTALLHPNKLREFHNFLQNPCKRPYSRIRRSIHQSVFNVFEVLYDSLPTDTKSELKFCFTEKVQPYYINLRAGGSQIEGEQLVTVLDILMKKNPEDFVQLFITNFPDNETDFFEVACKPAKVNRQVVNWLVEKIIPNIDCKQRSELNKYVDHRFNRYLHMVLQYNNVGFFIEAIQHAKSLWPKATINYFLRERNVLQIFLNTFELRNKGKPLKGDQRIRMVRIMHDLYQWAFDGKFRVSDDIRESMANLQVDATIKNAFIDTFLSL